MVTDVRFLLHCASPMGRPARVAILATVALLAFAGRARATEYPGWGDTGWIYASKAYCCNEAIGIASRYSEEECANTGGMPSEHGGEPATGAGGDPSVEVRPVVQIAAGLFHVCMLTDSGDVKCWGAGNPIRLWFQGSGNLSSRVFMRLATCW